MLSSHNYMYNKITMNDYSIYNPYTPCGRFWKSVPQGECEFSNATTCLLCEFKIRFITKEVNIVFRSAKWAYLIVGSGVRPPPFLFYPTLFIKAPLILKILDPHPFSNLYVSYIHFWCHGNVVDWHPIALLIYHFTYFQPEDIPIFSILFCKYKCTTWKSEEPHPL